MEASPLATMLWRVFCFTAAFEIFANVVESKNDAEKQNYNCPQSCACDIYLQRVNCTNADLREVPRDISSDTVSLILDGNSFSFLRNDSFAHLRRLSNLSLRHCQINEMDEEAFSSLSETLRVLWLSNTPLNKKGKTFLMPLRNLEYLDLSTTGRRYNGVKLRKLSKLKYVFLANLTFNIFPLQKLPTSLVFLDSSQNLIKILYEDRRFENYVNLKSLRLSGNAIQMLKDNNFRHFLKLENLDLSLNRLTEVQSLAFRSSSLKHINLYKSNFRLHEGNWNVFQQATNIERINMSQCRMDFGNLATSAFRNISYLSDLDISGTGISSLSKMFTNLPNLAKLRLNKNPISILSKSDFDEIAESLRELSLSSTRISCITHSSLPLKVWKNLRKVDFSDNPFLCDCNFVWLRRWLKRANVSKVKVEGWDKYYCQTSKGQVSMFQLESPSDWECFQDLLSDDPCLLTMLLLTMLFGFTTSTLSALHRYRWHIRYWYFMKTMNANKRADRNRDGEERDIFSFDVFVGYSRSDSSWVINQLLPRLERDYNLRVCIHERDWLAGRDIAENILESIDESRKTLLIVSNAFALSPWCHFELTMAQTRLMEEDRDSLVLILLEEIADCNLTPRLGIQMQRRTYIEWTKQSNVGQQLFWANLKHALARPSSSLMIESLTTQLFA